MISDAFFIWFVFQLLLFAMMVIGYARLPLLLIFVILISLLIAPATFEAFGEEYSMIALSMTLINISLSCIGLTARLRGA